MKSLIAVCAALLAFAAGSYAQNYNQSTPFYLILLSEDPTLNGTGLVACHEGAAIEGLCSAAALNISQIANNYFQFNTTTGFGSVNSSAGPVGYLTYALHGSNFNRECLIDLA